MAVLWSVTPRNRPFDIVILDYHPTPMLKRRVGNATRMAHNLGLHMDCSAWVTAGLLSEDEAEVRKVTWWGCFVVDK